MTTAIVQTTVRKYSYTSESIVSKKPKSFCDKLFCCFRRDEETKPLISHFSSSQNISSENSGNLYSSLSHNEILTIKNKELLKNLGSQKNIKILEQCKKVLLLFNYLDSEIERNKIEIMNLSENSNKQFCLSNCLKTLHINGVIKNSFLENDLYTQLTLIKKVYEYCDGEGYAPQGEQQNYRIVDIVGSLFECCSQKGAIDEPTSELEETSATPNSIKSPISVSNTPELLSRNIESPFFVTNDELLTPEMTNRKTDA